MIYHSGRDFHLQNDKISYIIRLLPNGHLGHVYFGGRLEQRDDWSSAFPVGDKAYAEPHPGRSWSLDWTPHEYPTDGQGDFHQPAFVIEQTDGSRVSDFKYVSHRVVKGKPRLEGLPATYVESDDEAETIVFELEDKEAGNRLELMYTIFRDYPAIARSARFSRVGKGSVAIRRAYSFSLDLADSDYEFITLSGAWARERYINRRPLVEGVQGVYSARGASSANFNPFMAFVRHNTDEQQGEAIGMSLVYSGNFDATCDMGTDGVTRAMIGIGDRSFTWSLGDGESFQTPEAVAVWSEDGLGGMSRAFHQLYGRRLAHGVWRDRPRPILINNWEGTYFNFDEQKIVEIAQEAAKLGVELFVLDDGWFGHRDDDHSSLGDWFVDKRKLPNGIVGLADKVRATGLKFGLWFEPEMVSPDSDLFRAHPDWAIGIPGRERTEGRNQYVLDFSRKEVVDFIFDLVDKTIVEAKLDYIKWDMNRNITEAFSQALPAEKQGEVFHRYILGVYDLYERLTSKHPEILFESCAGGGGRFDPGILYYAPQGWTSDDTDAVERLKIQYGTSMVYPQSSMGAHVSAVPNHQTGRITNIDTRASVAYYGAFGYELDPRKLTDEEKEAVKRQIAYYKQHRELFQYGELFRISSPFESNVTAWAAVSRDKSKALVGVWQVLNRPNQPLKRIRLAGLDPSRTYKYQLGTARGDELMRLGIDIRKLLRISGNYGDFIGDFMGRILELEAID